MTELLSNTEAEKGCMMGERRKKKENYITDSDLDGGGVHTGKVPVEMTKESGKDGQQG